MSKLTGSRFRVALNQASRNNFADGLGGTSQAITLWKNCSAIFQCAIFFQAPSAASMLTDLTNITSVECVLRNGSSTGALLCPEKTILAANINTALVYTDWDGGVSQHFEFDFTPDDLNFTPPGSIFMSIGATTNDAGVVVLGYNPGVKMTDPGLFNPGGDVVPALPYTGYSKAEATAMFAPAGAIGGIFKLRNRTTGTICPVLLDGPDNAPEVIVLPPGAAVPPITYRVDTAGQINLLNRTTGTFFPVVLDGPDNAPEIAVLPAS